MQPLCLSVCPLTGACAGVQVLGSKAIMLASFALGLQLPFDVHLPVRQPREPRQKLAPPLSAPDAFCLGAQVHSACLALLLASNPAACATPYATAPSGAARIVALARALAAGLKHVWMPLSPECLRLGCAPTLAHPAWGADPSNRARKVDRHCLNAGAVTATRLLPHPRPLPAWEERPPGMGSAAGDLPHDLLPRFLCALCTVRTHLRARRVPGRPSGASRRMHLPRLCRPRQIPTPPALRMRRQRAATRSYPSSCPTYPDPPTLQERCRKLLLQLWCPYLTPTLLTLTLTGPARRQRRQCELVLALLQLQLGTLLPGWLAYALEARSRAAFEAAALRRPPVQAPSVVLALTLVPLSALGLRALEALEAAYALWGC